MAYNSAIPQPGDLLSQSQDDILKNFQAINTFVSVNHEAFNSAAPHAQGKHKQLEMPVQAAAVATDPIQWSMYVKNNALGVPAPAIFLRPPVSAQHPAGAEIDMTTATLGATGWCRLPCGLKMAWGTINITAAGVYALPAAAGFTAIYSIVLTPISGGGTKTYCSVYNVGANNFKATSYNANVHFTDVAAYYVALGV